MSTHSYVALVGLALLVVIAETQINFPPCEPGWTRVQRQPKSTQMITQSWCLKAFLASGEEWSADEAKLECEKNGAILSSPESYDEMELITKDIDTNDRIIFAINGRLREQCRNETALGLDSCIGELAHDYEEGHLYSGYVFGNFSREWHQLMENVRPIQECIGLKYEPGLMAACNKEEGFSVPLHCKKFDGSRAANGAICGKFAKYDISSLLELFQ